MRCLCPLCWALQWGMDPYNLEGLQVPEGLMV